MLIFNKLRVIKKPNVEKFFQKINLFFLDIDDYLRNGCRTKTAFVFPHFPSKKTTLYKILRKNRIPIVNDSHPSNIIKVKFTDATFDNINSSYIFDINQDASDISKHKVDEIHQSIFGYCTTIDPQQFHGQGVVKSIFNARHDGVETLFPIKFRENDKIYQIVIDNFDGKWFVDHRVCVIGHEIALIYWKYKTRENRFTNEVTQASIAPIDCIPESIKNKIILFTQKMNCNFCELDVLKDNNNKNWYIIDVNKTPYGPPAALSEREKKKAIQILSQSFSNHFIK